MTKLHMHVHIDFRHIHGVVPDSLRRCQASSLVECDWSDW